MKKDDINYPTHLLKMKLRYYQKIKNNPEEVEKRRLYYKKYYEENKYTIQNKRKLYNKKYYEEKKRYPNNVSSIYSRTNKFKNNITIEKKSLMLFLC